MPLFTKFPRTKLITIIVSTLALASVWSALAWPDWTAPAKAAKPNPSVAALVALSKLPAQQLAALTAPPPPAGREVVHRTVAVQRTVGQPAVIVVASDGTTSVQAPQQNVAPSQPQSAAAPVNGATPTSGNQPPPPPSQPGAPPPPQPTVPVAAPPPSQPTVAPPPEPTATSAPPPPTPTPTAAPPPPAPTPTSGSAPP